MPKTIFVIDDDTNLQKVLKVALNESGYHVALASNGEEALANLTAVQPDMVLCDVMMPYLDGAQVWDVLHQRLQYSGIPFIVLTALDRKPWFTELEAEGAVIIQKPFDLERLLAIVDSYLRA